MYAALEMSCFFDTSWLSRVAVDLGFHFSKNTSYAHTNVGIFRYDASRGEGAFVTTYSSLCHCDVVGSEEIGHQSFSPATVFKTVLKHIVKPRSPSFFTLALVT